MRFVSLAAACALAAAPAAAQSLRDDALVANEVEAVVTVVAVDLKKRTVTFSVPKGGASTFDVPKESQNLERVKKGDRFKVKYLESMAVSIQKGGAPADTESKDVKFAAKGANPGGTIVQTRTRAVVVDAIDLTNRYVAVRGTNGQTQALKAVDGVPLEQLSIGDRITVTYTRAIALTMEPQPAKPAAKSATHKF